MLADGQAQPSPGLRGSLAAQLHERKEDALAILLADAGPGILHLKSYFGFFGPVRVPASLARSFTPPESVYLMALPSRFSSTWRSLPASTATNRGRSGSRSKAKLESLFRGPDPHQRLHFVQ